MEPAALRILLVDDEARNLDALEAILGGSGYHLIRALSGDEALSALLRNDVAAIVLDVNMPGLGGVELARIIKGNSKFRHIPVLFLTAYLLDDQDVIAGYGAGAVDYLMKPVNPAILRQKIGIFADLFRKTRALAELNQTLEARIQERTAELEQSEAALRVASRQKDEFLATLAHELRNPLAPLRMGLDLLLRSSNVESNRTLSVMNRQLDHMVRLIDDLLDVGRISSGRLELKKSHIRVFDAVQTAIETTRPFFEQREQRIATRIDPSLVSFADPTRVTQIVGNLLHNASKFTAKGGVVELDLTFEASHAVVRVTDHGVGIAPEHLSRVFDMFARVEEPGTSQHQGLGIGLALAQKLAQMHDGELSVASAGLGQGSVFSFSFPAQTDAAVPPPSVRPPALTSTSAPTSVLVIEDNVDSAEMLTFALESRGYTVSAAHTGAEGLALLQQRRQRVVLCDIGLPEMDGTEVCRQVRELELGYRPVMIALTGWGMAEDRQRTKNAGFDHHLVKPVAPEKLYALLDSIGSDTLG